MMTHTSNEQGNNLRRPSRAAGMLLRMAALLLATAALHGDASAQAAGTTAVVSVTLSRSAEPVLGWSVQRGLLGRIVYGEQGQKIGKVEDVVVISAPAPYVLVISVGGFVGLGKHVVAIPLDDVLEQGGRLVLPGASKATLKALPVFTYSSMMMLRSQFIRDATAQLATANEQLVQLKKRADAATGASKTELEKGNAALQADITAGEDKLADLKKAEAARWVLLKEDVRQAIARIKAVIVHTSAEPAPDAAPPPADADASRRP
ncbi:PRC-barrel domain-containing protein [Janthinobacterium sp. HLX7-2]|uniref:PRC-barrel domain-containing protein n=1 Tax=Janthinobacterium sp. HLX7-2 TaxID=1259331 RepID=UPI003F230067